MKFKKNKNIVDNLNINVNKQRTQSDQKKQSKKHILIFFLVLIILSIILIISLIILYFFNNYLNSKNRNIAKTEYALFADFKTNKIYKTKNKTLNIILNKDNNTLVSQNLSSSQKDVTSLSIYAREPNEVTSFEDFKQIYYFKKGLVLARKKDNTLVFQKIDAYGNINREVINTIKSSIDIASDIEIMENASNVYIIYTFPDSGIRLITIDKDNNVTTNFFDDKDFGKYFDSNEVFLMNNKIYIPNETYNFVIDLSNDTISKINLNTITNLCGEGTWNLESNSSFFYIFTSSNTNKVCVLNLQTNSQILLKDSNTSLISSTTSTSQGTWYKVIPELNFLVSEDFNIKDTLSSSNGIIHIFNYITQVKKDIDLSSDKIYIQSLKDSPGGLYLSFSYYIDKKGMSINFIPRATSNREVISISLSDYSLKMYMNNVNYNFLNLYYYLGS